MKTILVPSDFSPNANKALNYAAQIAKLSGASIIIVHVTDLTHASMNENVILPESFDKEIIDNAHKYHYYIASHSKCIFLSSSNSNTEAKKLALEKLKPNIDNLINKKIVIVKIKSVADKYEKQKKTKCFTDCININEIGRPINTVNQVFCFKNSNFNCPCN